MTEITLEALEARKTALIAQLARNPIDYVRVELGAKIHLVDELINELQPLPAEQSYFVLYEVRWQPTSADDTDAPMDRDHTLDVTDERCTGRGMVAIGQRAHIIRELARWDDA